MDELEDLLLELSNEQNMVGQYSEHSAYVSEVLLYSMLFCSFHSNSTILFAVTILDY